jgi:hypothetical protein
MAAPTDRPPLDTREVAVRGLLLGRRALLALLGAVLLTPAAPAGAEAALQVSATETPGRFEFIATGFEAQETISTWLTGPSQQVVAAPLRKVDNDGEILFTLRLPRYFEPGTWALTAHGLSSDREAVVSFDLPPRGPDLAMAVEPADGPPGTTFTFSAEGFQGGERVSWWLTGPDGASIDGGVLDASATGRVRIEYQTTTNTAIGPWTLVAYGVQSDHLALAAFTVTDG